MSFRVDVLEGVRIALFSLRSNRLRTVLTTVGIGVGVCTLLAIVGIIQGLNTSFANQLAQLGTNTLFVRKFPWVVMDDWWQYRNRKDLSLDLVEVVRQSEYVVAVSPVLWASADLGFAGRQLSSVQVRGVTADYAQVTSNELTAGRFLTEADQESRNHVVVIGADVARELFPQLNPVGHRITVRGRPYTVVGVLAPKGQILGESQDLIITIPYNTFLGHLGKKQSPQLIVAVDSPDNLLKAEDQLVALLRRARGTPPDKPDDFSINRPDQLANTYQKLTGALYGAASGVGLITLLVGGIGIMNIMLVSVRERTREIGIRRALGARRRTIVIQFLLEAASVSAVGGILGTVVGLGLAKVVSLITPLAAAVQPLTVAFGVGFSAMVGLLFGIWPAARAAHLDPVEALRHE
ncbi:ABC transporter permease [Myxococcaceae bacterium GXIMD 01537]